MADRDDAAGLRAKLQAVAEAGLAAPRGEQEEQGPGHGGLLEILGNYRIPLRSKKSGKKRKKSGRGSSGSSSGSSAVSSDSDTSGTSESERPRKAPKKKGKKGAVESDLPLAKDIKFEKRTHEHQYRTNEEISQRLRKAMRAIRKKKLSKTQHQLGKIGAIVRERQEMILIGDVYDWGVVKAMETNENLKGLSKERAKALKEALKTSGARAGTSVQGRQGTSGYNRPSSSGLSKKEVAYNAMVRKGSCNNCGELGHWERECKAPRRERNQGGPSADPPALDGSSAQG